MLFLVVMPRRPRALPSAPHCPVHGCSNLPGEVPPAHAPMLRHAARVAFAAARRPPAAAHESLAPRALSTSKGSLDEKAPANAAEDSAAARRATAEKLAAKDVQSWSSPLFSHVEVDVDDGRAIPRWANYVFVAAVVAVFGYCGHFAYQGETRKAEARERARSQTEERARRAIDGGALREHRTRSFLDPGEGDDDPFDGLSPEEIAKLAEGEGKRETEGGA